MGEGFAKGQRVKEVLRVSTPPSLEARLAGTGSNL